MDPLDEFAFKPLTEGLGFHKKKKGSNSAAEMTKLASGAGHTPSTSPNKNNSNNIKNKGEAHLLKSPLPKKEILPNSTGEVASKEVIDELVRNFKKSKSSTGSSALPEEASKPQVIINPVMPQIDEESYPLPWMVSPFLIDAMLVMALVLSSLMAVLLITKIDLLLMLVQSSSDIELWMTFPAIAVAMIMAYMSLTRILFGSTLGELVFDVQLGTKEQQSRSTYYLLVIGRTAISIVTGLVLLPAFSLIFRKDYLGQWSGLKLFRRKK